MIFNRAIKSKCSFLLIPRVTQEPKIVGIFLKNDFVGKTSTFTINSRKFFWACYRPTKRKENFSFLQLVVFYAKITKLIYIQKI